MKNLVAVTLALIFTSGFAFAQATTGQTPPPAGGMASPQAVAPAARAPQMPASPRGSVATQVSGKWETPKEGAEPRYTGGKWITIDYGRPILRGRKNIFGSGADYGKKVYAGASVWRAGANQTTRLKTEAPLILGSKTLEPGEYSLFVDLKENAWTLIVSTQPFQEKYVPTDKTNTWGAYNYDPKFDVVRVPMTVTMRPNMSIDQFSIFFMNVTDQGGTLGMTWDTTLATTDFKLGGGATK